MSKKILSIILALLMLSSMLVVPTFANDSVELDLTSGSVAITATGYSVAGGTEVAHTGNYVIKTSEQTANTVTATGVTTQITLDNVDISRQEAGDLTAIAIASSADVTLMLKGTNKIALAQSTSDTYLGAAIEVDETSKVTIDAVDDTASLTANGGAYSAAIGSPSYKDAGTYASTAQIVINGGIINATAGGTAVGSGSESAAIGGSRYSGAQVTINGGNVTATAYRNASAIGNGRACLSKGSSVTINGGTVTAYASQNGAGIGSSFQSEGIDILITGGTVTGIANVTNARSGIGGGTDCKSRNTITIRGGTVIGQGYANGAGIGGDNKAPATINIYDGHITATGGTNGAGIGTASWTPTTTGTDTATIVNIYGGTVIATGGTTAAAIGNGNNYTGGTQINISGGTITATADTSGTSGGAAIGAGYKSTAAVNITGGNITATTGGWGGAGIGVGRECPEGSTVNISGGIINATAGLNAAGIGGGFKSGADVTISGGVINAISGHKTAAMGVSATAVDFSAVTTYTKTPKVYVTGGTILSYYMNGTTNNEITAYADADAAEALKRNTIALPEGVSSPYQLWINNEVVEYAALNSDNTLNIYKNTQDIIAAVCVGETCYLAMSEDGSIAASEWTVVGSDDVNYLGWQESADTDTTDVRFIGTINNVENYKSVGVHVVITGDAERVFHGSSEHVYKKILGSDSQGNVFDAADASELGVDALFLATLRGLPNEGTYNITVIVEAVTNDGTVVYDVPSAMTVADGVFPS